MSKIGIIANPNSGKDIRRLVSFATTINNQEKVNIVKRIVLAAQDMGVDEVIMMREAFAMAERVEDDLKLEEMLRCKITTLEQKMRNDFTDTEIAATMMAQMGAKCIIVLGGDGTSRAAAKSTRDVPFIPVSTGTNNVYPKLLEGTVVGMAAAAIAEYGYSDEYCIKDKIIEIKKNGEVVDIALIDAVIAEDLWSGSKAVWQTDKISKIFVTRAHPASIGFSAIAGSLRVIRDDEDKGLCVDLLKEGKKIKTAIAAGIITQVCVGEPYEMSLNEPYELVVKQGCMVAVDGEREVYAAEGDKLTFTIKREGPIRLKHQEILEYAVDKGFYNV